MIVPGDLDQGIGLHEPIQFPQTEQGGLSVVE